MTGRARSIEAALSGDDGLLSGEENLLSGDENLLSGEEQFLSGEEHFLDVEGRSLPVYRRVLDVPCDPSIGTRIGTPSRGRADAGEARAIVRTFLPSPCIANFLARNWLLIF
jgi:hypothetical protein